MVGNERKGEIWKRIRRWNQWVNGRRLSEV